MDPVLSVSYATIASFFEAAEGNFRNASYVYKENALDKYLYVCSGYPECDAYVGVHAKSLRPKGSLANGDLRHKRIETHRLFDAIWKNGIFSRKEAYRWMQDTFSLNSSQAHIGQFSDYRCDCLMDTDK